MQVNFSLGELILKLLRPGLIEWHTPILGEKTEILN